MPRRYLMLLPLLALAGCPKIGELENALEELKPTVSFKNFNLRDINFQGADVDFVFAVENPNPLQIAFTSFTYDLALASQPFFSGVQPDGLKLEAQGTSDLVVPVSVTFSELLSTVSDIKGQDDVPYNFSGAFGFNTPMGEMKIPFEQIGDFPVLRAPKVQLSQLRVAELAVLQNRAVLELDMLLSHEQGSNLDFKDFDYGLTLDGAQVAKGVLPQLATVAAGESQTVTLPIELNLLDLGAGVVNALRNKSELDVGLKAGLGVGTPFGEIPWDIDKSKRLNLQ